MYSLASSVQSQVSKNLNDATASASSYALSDLYYPASSSYDSYLSQASSSSVSASKSAESVASSISKNAPASASSASKSIESAASQASKDAKNLSKSASKTGSAAFAQATDGVAATYNDATDYVYSTWDDNTLRSWLEANGVIKTKSEAKRDELLSSMKDAYSTTVNAPYETFSDSYLVS